MAQAGVSFVMSWILTACRYIIRRTPEENGTEKMIGVIQSTSFPPYRTLLFYNDDADLNATLADVRLGPPTPRCQRYVHTTRDATHFLMRIDSIAMNPVVSVGSKPPSSSIEDCFSS